MESTPHAERLKVPQPLTQFIAEERGQSLVEYALLLTLITISIAAALTLFGWKFNLSYLLNLWKAQEGAE
jgi:Flp pilus assembly pilin Flp